MKTKTQKGITLIALIITIIVMLILVGVSVSIALNSGLFKAAQGAAKGTNEHKENETKLSSGMVTIINSTTGKAEEVDINSFRSAEDVVEYQLKIDASDSVSYRRDRYG